MKRHLKRIFARDLGSALVLTLVMVVLITVIIVGYIASVSLETKSAKSALDAQKANGMAMLGLNTAIAQLRDGLGVWDDPFGNFMGSNTPPTYYWSVSPGVLTRWAYTNATALTNVPLFSVSTTTNLVNLNASSSDGSYPIVGGTNPPAISVKWANVLENPTAPASITNQIIGRYAFWMDDESAKINVNTADGTQKYTTNSAGLGTPSELSLLALKQSGAAISTATASNIVQLARTDGFHTLGEILRASGVTTNLLKENVFNLTVSSRSPEINIFGEPKTFFIPGFPTVASPANGNFFATNGITLQPLSELYPTPSQLPGFTYADLYTPASGNNTNSWSGSILNGGPRPWPLLFMQQIPSIDFCKNGNLYQANAPGFNIALLSKYLSGFNGMGKAIQWPTFPGTIQPAQGFAGKYTARQRDSLTVQIADLGAKAISPERGNANDVAVPGSESYPYVTPTTTFGYLSGKLVSGMGRFGKVNEAVVNVVAFPGNGTNAPYVQMATYLEWFFPAGFAGVDLYNNNKATSGIGLQGGAVKLGSSINQGYLNVQDLPGDATGKTVVPITKTAPLPPYSYWGDTLFHNNQGIDMVGNPGVQTSGAELQDPDPGKAAMFHPYCLTTNSIYVGSGLGVPNTAPAPALRMKNPFGETATVVAANPWQPGSYRSHISYNAAILYRTAPGVTNITFTGGIAVNSVSRSTQGDLDPVPLESMRGLRTLETNAAGILPSIADQVASSVIPFQFSVPVPSTVAGVTVHAEVADPLVNKFPGDWVVTQNGLNSMTLPANLSPFIATYTNGVNAVALAHPHYDPDSFWMPTIPATNNAMPRSQRMPNIGYLQYLRTGLIPDDEGGSYTNQHGTPYRLLSFAPSTDSANQKTTLSTSLAYPDWALLDLFTIPSNLKPYGTSGGSTFGRLNPNGAVIYTTNANVPTPGIVRLEPLQALFKGLMVNQSINANGQWSGGSAVDEVALAQAIANYLTANGPFRMPAEICNVPAVSALAAPSNPTRNDLVRQTVGDLATQSNVFSVWVAGQTVRKNPANSTYGAFEDRDTVNGEIRVHFLVERYLDPGADGVYGNSTSPGNDGIVGTWDDLYDPQNHPKNPKYLYRVIFSEEIRR